MASEHAPSDCLDPELGRDLEAYFRDELSPEAAASFEEHCLSCPSCLEEVQLRLATSSDTEGGEPSRSWMGRFGWPVLAAASLAAIIAFTIFLLPAPEAPLGPFPLELEGGLRGAGDTPQAPAGAPLDISLFVPVANREGVRYDVRIENEAGKVLFETWGLSATGRSQVRFQVPGRTTVRPGRHVVILYEKVPGEAVPLELRFGFEVVER